MKVKTSELTGAALDGVVNQIEECCDDPNTPMFSTSWAQGGPIIEREKIDLNCWAFHSVPWKAGIDGEFEAVGPTPLIAAMRCYVVSKLGDTVAVED